MLAGQRSGTQKAEELLEQYLRVLAPLFALRDLFLGEETKLSVRYVQHIEWVHQGLEQGAARLNLHQHEQMNTIIFPLKKDIQTPYHQ